MDQTIERQDQETYQEHTFFMTKRDMMGVREWQSPY